MRTVSRLAMATVVLMLTAWLIALTGPANLQVIHAQDKPVPTPQEIAANIPPMGVKQADEPIYTIPPIEREVVNVIRELHAKGDVTWNNTILNVPEAWKKTKGKDIVIAILDTGVDANHPDLKGRIIKEKNFTRSPSFNDRQGHGTHCAGIAAASGDLTGVAPEAKILNGKVLDDGGSGGTDGIAAGIDWAVAEGADVISMSLGGASPDPHMPAAIKRATDAGVIVIVAAGNEGPGPNTDGYPARYEGVISVAACDKNKAIANFSSRGKSVWITAPGVNVRSTYPGGQYATMSGTSMACPGAAGVAALWCAGNVNVAKKDRPSAVKNWFKAVGSVAVRTDASGYGIPDAGKINDGGGPVVPPPVTPTPGINFTVAFTDLSATKQAELRAGGIDKLRLEIGTGSPVVPSPPIPIDPPQPMPPTPIPISPPRCIGPGCNQGQDSGGWYPGKLVDKILRR